MHKVKVVYFTSIHDLSSSSMNALSDENSGPSPTEPSEIPFQEHSRHISPCPLHLDPTLSAEPWRR